MNDSSERLLAYYTRIMDTSGKEYNKQQMAEIIKRISSEDAKIILDADDASLNQATRLLAYATKLNEYQKKKAEDMEKLLDSVGDYNFAKERHIEINGNTFTYTDDFPIDNYIDELSKVGDTEQGEEYSVQLMDGKLVIY